MLTSVEGELVVVRQHNGLGVVWEHFSGDQIEWVAWCTTSEPFTVPQWRGTLTEEEGIIAMCKVCRASGKRCPHA